MAVLQEIKVPLLSVNDRVLTVIETPFFTGDKVNKGDVILVFETSKTTYDVETEVSGYVQYFCIAGNDYEVDETVIIIYDSASEMTVIPNVKTPEKIGQQKSTSPSGWKGKPLFSHGAMELIGTKGIDENVFAGQDFVNTEDVLIYLGKGPEKIQIPSRQTRTSKAINILPNDNANLVVKRLSSYKKREIEFLSSVQSAGITSTINTYIDTEGIFVHLNASLKALKNSLLPVIIYEASRLLQKYKELNAFYHDEAVYYYDKINIGFAIDLDKGLKVLKVSEASNKAIGMIEDDIISLSGKYLDDSLHIGDLTDVTFTITDLSLENVAFFNPLVNFMNSAILGVSSIDEKLDRCVLTLTFDHRVTEGKRVARFLSELKERLESYRSNHGIKQLGKITCFKCFRSLQEDLSEVGFAKCITPNGDDAFICQSCLNGY